jgi:small subunit ribosomal protein S6
MVIFDANRYARDPQGLAERFQKIVAKFGGDVLVSRLWNEQKLAYPIKNQRKGVYWLTYFRFDSTKLAEFRRACQLNDDILRSLVLKIDPRLIDALVAHAKGEAPKPVDIDPSTIAVDDVASEEGAEVTDEAEKEESFA